MWPTFIVLLPAWRDQENEGRWLGGLGTPAADLLSVTLSVMQGVCTLWFCVCGGSVDPVCKRDERLQYELVKVKVKFFPYSLPSVGPGADPGVQAVSPQVT